MQDLYTLKFSCTEIDKLDQAFYTSVEAANFEISNEVQLDLSEYLHRILGFIAFFFFYFHL